ncbi:serine carboxypeptidase S28 [Ancylostoma duodenale]|uniref:Serine carboxypeptidase S28 n=1 Tax=Ancylostoma duodenale TaxID=51022 RepID=A0A0C2GTA5_9BILA|nr:serine carboxypeptidase S28 [Ancylostoma duodenale]
MTLLKLCALLLLGLAVAVQCAPQKKFRRHMVRGRPMSGFVPKPIRNEKFVGKNLAVAGLFQNKVDHFNTSNSATYNQRYWYNDQWYKPGGPAFLMLGGESGEDPYWVEDGTLEWTQMAADNGAFVFLIEHRFYGESKPTPDMSTPNLVYLSSAQALEDMAAFIIAMKQKFPQLAAAPWVTFGGSYSGALAAWARVKHPELVAMAVGSSGPVQAEVDFVEYLEVVQNSITRDSAQCAQSVTTAFNLVSSMLTTASGRQSLKATFNLCEDLDPSNAQQIETFWQTVYSPYMEVVQYSGDSAGLFQNLLTIHNAICRFHDTDASSLTKLKQVNNYFNQLSGYFGCQDIDYQNFIEFMQDTTYGDAQEIRAWVWQTCTEFGYYQSTDSDTAGPFFGGKPALPVKYYIDECTNIYGSQYNSASVASAVANVNAYYGGRDNMQSSYIVLPNGNIDPWHALGKLNSTISTIIPVVIDGTAHCADMYGSSLSDSPSLTAARQKISAQIKEWLQQIN